MRRFQLAVVGVTLLFTGSGPAMAQVPPSCLHGPSETAADQARREQAIELAHTINRAENRSYNFSGRRGEYLPLDELLANLNVGAPATPEGFQVQLHTDGTAYAFSIKDMSDPCRYAVFSDQTGDVYDGTPTMPEVGMRLLSRD